MSIDRRSFLKLVVAAGAGGAAGAEALKALASDTEVLGPHSPLPGGENGVPRYAMIVDVRKLDSPEKLEALFTACHVAHNVPKIENRDDEIKWIWDEPFEETFPTQHHDHMPKDLQHRPVPVLCNHCDNPPCTRVCPTQATWKRKADNLVMMDWHRCIGCRYCIVACPYGSRSFNYFEPRPNIDDIQPDFPTRRKGVVEKCTFCNERLARGQEPACVEASNGALIFGDLNDPDSAIVKILAEKLTIRRKPALGTEPQVYYIV